MIHFSLLYFLFEVVMEFIKTMRFMCVGAFALGVSVHSVSAFAQGVGSRASGRAMMGMCIK